MPEISPGISWKPQGRPSAPAEALQREGVLTARDHAAVSGHGPEEVVRIELAAEAIDVRLVLAQGRHAGVEGGGHVHVVRRGRGSGHIDVLDPLPWRTDLRPQPT